MTKDQGFGRLTRLRETQKEEGAESAPESAPVQVPTLSLGAPELEMPNLPDLPTPQREATKLLSAQVPVSRKLAFDRQVLDAKTYFPDLEMREGVTALISMLDDERVRRMWLHEIQKLKAGQR